MPEQLPDKLPPLYGMPLLTARSNFSIKVDLPLPDLRWSRSKDGTGGRRTLFTLMTWNACLRSGVRSSHPRKKGNSGPHAALRWRVPLVLISCCASTRRDRETVGMARSWI
jgi:hypothetical protein